VIYFLLATIVSHISDLLAALLAWRSKMLERGVGQLLGDPQLTARLLAHPLLAALQRSEGRAPSFIPSNLFAAALQQLVDGAAGHDEEAGMADFRLKVLPVLVAAADATTPQATRQAIAAWFDAAMDRLSTAYKRRIQWVLLGLSAVITAVIGADSLGLASTIWHDQSVRDAVAAAAQSASGSLSLQEALKQLAGLDLPLGWASLPDTPQGWVLKAIGLAITTLAVSLGAPFWFDLLKSITSLRSSGSSSQS
jgi:hypothetical protein